MAADMQSTNRPKAREGSNPFATDGTQNIFEAPRPTSPQLTPSAGGPFFHDYTFDTTLSVPEPLEPRMETILGREIPEFRWNDEAENWGKIRILGTTPDASPRVTVSIARKEPPGPFKLRISIRGALEPAAEAFRKAITQRIELALYAAAKGSPTVASSPSSFTIRFTPPFFSQESLFHVPETLESRMALRIKAAIPELIWVDNAPDWDHVRIVAGSNNPYRRTAVSILRGGPVGPFQLWMHTTAISPAIGQEVLTSLLDRILAASAATPPDVTFESRLSILEPQASILESTLRERIPELNWQNPAESEDPENRDKLLITGALPGPTPRVLVSITREEQSSSLPTAIHIGIHIRIVLRGCFEAQAETFHQALLQRLHFSLCPATFSHVQPIQPAASLPAAISYAIPFVPPFFSLRADVPVAQEFEEDTMAAFVARLEDNIPELSWCGLAETGREIRIAAEMLGQFESPAGVPPTPNSIQRTCLSLFRRSPFSPFDLWIHITAASADDADRALHFLEHRVHLALRSAYAGPYVPLPGNSMTRVLPAAYPPIFRFDFLVKSPQSFPPGIESRLHDLVGLLWSAIARNGKQSGLYGSKEDMHGFTLMHIQLQDAPDLLRVFVDTTAESAERYENYRKFVANKMRQAFQGTVIADWV